MSNSTTSAEDDEGSIGQISDGEGQEIETTEGDGLRRLASEEAPLLVGQSARTDSASIDPLDDESDESVLLDAVEDRHAEYPGPCSFFCLNDEVNDCECECEKCMFQYYNQEPPDMEKFNSLLRRNFRSALSESLTDPLQRHFGARRPYDYTQKSESQSCTQMIPWRANILNWFDPCPHSHQGGHYEDKVLPCNEIFCGRDLNAIDAEEEEEVRSYHSQDFNDPTRRRQHEEESREEPYPDKRYPWQRAPDELFDEDHDPIQQYVCETHIEDSKAFYHMGRNLDNLYKAHLIRYCEVHEAELRQKYPDGARTCTCHNVDFTRWQCRSCFQTKVEKLQRHFRRRVNPKWRGNADTDVTNDYRYQRNWRKRSDFVAEGASSAQIAQSTPRERPMQDMKAIIPKMPLSGLLSLTKAQFHSQYRPSLRYNRLLVGAIIFNSSTTTGNRLLLLKRAVHDPAFPNFFSIPGGHVEDSDLSLFHALKQEVFEETTMSVQAVIDQIDPLAWITLRGTQGEEKVSETGFTSLQIPFVCDVEGVTVHVDPEEHSMGVWADREEAVGLDMSVGMRGVVENAFRWKEAELERGSKGHD